MNLQERIDFILKNNFPASVKRKHLIYLIQHLGYYSEDADELGISYTVISEAIEQLDNERSTYDKGANGDLHNEIMMNQPLTVTELDRTLEFFLTYNILSMQQVQEIRTKAAAYLR